MNEISNTQAMKRLDVGRARLHQLVKDGRIKRLRRGVICLASVETELRRRKTQREDTWMTRWPPSRRSQMSVVATLLAVDLIDVDEIDLKKLRKTSGISRGDLRGLMLEKRLRKIGADPQ